MDAGDARSGIYNILALSERRKKARFRTAYDPERQEAPKEAEEEDRGKKYLADLSLEVYWKHLSKHFSIFSPIFRFAGLIDHKWYRISLNLLTEDILQWMWVWIDMKWCPFSSHGDAVAPTTVLFMLNH